jgi:phage gpG-like protein
MILRLSNISFPVFRVATPERLAALGLYLVQQVKDRFRSQGASGGRPWLPKRRQDGRAVLTGRIGRLLNSFAHAIVGKSSVAVFSDTPYAKVHQLGTVGKGGTLPTIYPRRARALWIPLTDAAARMGPTRMVVGRGGFRGAKSALVAGKDFIFAKKVDIPPRRMLPESRNEQANQAEFIGDLIHG